MADPARRALLELVLGQGADLASLSRLLGKNQSYLQQYLFRGSPRALHEGDRIMLATYFGVAEERLGAPVRRAPVKDAADRLHQVLVPQYDVGASAGLGAAVEGEALTGGVSFDRRWLRAIGVSPSNVSLIRVQGDSMTPALNDGDDILVDHSVLRARIKSGIYVVRMDDMLWVKSIVRKGDAAKVDVISENKDFPSWKGVPLNRLNIIGRVIWAGRRMV